MCGIAGLIHRGKTGDIGQEMTAMLQSLKHRGPDSTGYALYGKPHGKELVLRFKVAEQDEMAKGFDIHHQVQRAPGRGRQAPGGDGRQGARAGSRRPNTPIAIASNTTATGASSPTTSRMSTAPRSSPSASASS